MSPRVAVVDRRGRAALEIRAPRSWPLLLFLPVWLAAWAAGGFAALASFRREPQPFLALWLTGWAFGFATAVSAWCWNAFGWERVSAEEGRLRLAAGVGPWQKRREFPLDAVTNLRASGTFEPTMRHSLRAWGLGPGTVAFDHAGRTERFGVQLSEAEANAVVRQLGSWTGGRTFHVSR